MKTNDESYVHSLSRWPEVTQTVNGGWIWDSNPDESLTVWASHRYAGINREMALRAGRGTSMPVFAWAAHTLFLTFHCLWIGLQSTEVIVSRISEFYGGIQTSKQSFRICAAICKYSQCLWGGGSSLAPQVSSECHPFLKPRVCVCVLMSFLIWFLKKFNEIDNLLFLHVSFLHLGFELKFRLILHSLSWNHSC